MLLSLTNGTEIYAGIYSGGVLKSTDNGFNFTQTTSFNGYQLNSILADGTNIIAGSSSGGGIFVSTNKEPTGHRRMMDLTVGVRLYQNFCMQTDISLQEVAHKSGEEISKIYYR